MGIRTSFIWAVKKYIAEAILIAYAFAATQAFISCSKSHTPIIMLHDNSSVQARVLVNMPLSQLAQVKVDI